MERNDPLSPPKPKNIHGGHRKRTKQKFLENGGDGFHDHQLLEMILFYAHPQGDVNPLAHELMNRFGATTPPLCSSCFPPFCAASMDTRSSRAPR